MASRNLHGDERQGRAASKSGGNRRAQCPPTRGTCQPPNPSEIFQRSNAAKNGHRSPRATPSAPSDNEKARELVTLDGTIATCGIIVVEGFNDVLGLDALGISAFAIMSNKITEDQVAKVVRFAKALAGGKVTLLFDADDAGDEGAKEALWLLAQQGLNVRLGWSRAMHEGKFAGRQPELLTQESKAEFLALTRLLEFH